MIYINANTAEEIGLALRGRSGEYDEKVRAAEVADRLLGIKKTISGIIVTAPRQSGKTTELLRYAEEKYPNGQFAIVTLNDSVQQAILHRYWSLLRPNVAGMPPLALTPNNLNLYRRHGTRPIFCDEWDLYPEQARKTILETGQFVAAVTS